MRVIRASLADIENAAFLLREYDAFLGTAKREDTPETIADFIAGHASGLWLAFVDDIPAGCVVLRPLPLVPGATECKRLFVQPQFRRRGIAEALLNALEDGARAAGENWIYLETKDDLLDSVRIYRRRGYGTCERFNDNPLATIFLRKSLRRDTEEHTMSDMHELPNPMQDGQMGPGTHPAPIAPRHTHKDVVEAEQQAASSIELTGAEIVWATLEGEGVREVFGYPGGAILPVYDALRKFPIKHILVRHEQGATHMADGYARASGRVGVAIATSGPGATNMVTGLATAMLDSIPIVCITGQVSSKVLGSDAFQEVDITGATLPVTKHNYLLTRADEIAPVLREAFAVAGSGRPGPVLVDITKDAQQGLAKFNFAAAAPKARRPHPMLFAEANSIAEAAELIRAAKRPVILAGHGVIKAAATEQVLTLAERMRIPVATTLLGLGGFPASHPLALGMMGMHGESWVNDAIQNADLLIACGMRFDDRVTGTLATYAPQAKKIHIEIDPAEINKNVKVDVALLGDLRAVLEALLPRLNAVEGESAWVKQIDASKGEGAVRDVRNLPDLGHLYAAHVMHDLWRATEGNAIVATDVGQHQMWEAQYYKHERPRTLITSGGLGTMGFALPAGIGAKVACPDREVWVIAGDGGFQMTACELSTIAQERLDINIAIVNNGYLGMVRQWQEFFYDRNYASSPILSPDFVKLADAHGIPGVTVRSRGEVDAALELARSTKGPFLINFLVEKEESVYPMIPAGAALHEMIRRPSGSFGGSDPMLETGEDG